MKELVGLSYEAMKEWVKIMEELTSVTWYKVMNNSTYNSVDYTIEYKEG